HRHRRRHRVVASGVVRRRIRCEVREVNRHHHGRLRPVVVVVVLVLHCHRRWFRFVAVAAALGGGVFGRCRLPTGAASLVGACGGFLPGRALAAFLLARRRRRWRLVAFAVLAFVFARALLVRRRGRLLAAIAVALLAFFRRRSR
ncbi:Os01g0192401, partial [Oryza sativa Japonica Group]